MRLFNRYKNPGPLKPTANPYPSRISSFKKGGVPIAGMLLLLLLVILRVSPTYYTSASSLLFEGVTSLHQLFLQPFQEINEWLKESYAAIHLKQNYKRLLQENKALKWKVQLLEPLYRENISLKQQLNVQTPLPYKHLIARVIATPYDGVHYSFLIAAGTTQGLEANQAVVVAEGILGRLDKVGHHTARVLLLNDINSRIPVLTETSNQKAILAGGTDALPSLVYVTDIQKVQKGERVVTSGFGGVFPHGLPVGRIEDVSNGKIHVRPYATCHTLDWVHVLRPQPNTFIEDIQTTLEEK